MAEHSPLLINNLPDSLCMDVFLQPKGLRPRQMQGMFYRLNGEIYIVSIGNLFRFDTIYHNSVAYIMEQELSVDIDTELDFTIAETVIKYRRLNNRFEENQ